MSSVLQFETRDVAEKPTNRGPLRFLAAVLSAAHIHPSIKFESIEAIHRISEALAMRGETSREYVFADVLFRTCLAPRPGDRALYQTLEARFRKFDRRQEEVKLLQTELPVAGREKELSRLALTVSSTVKLVRLFHLAAACDAEGPWSQSEEKDHILSLMAKILVGRGIDGDNENER